jgi:multiple RNA-binding domain-containing protein 1
MYKTHALQPNQLSKPAKTALKGLAYKRYRRVPIYLEWAPHGLFKSDAAVAAANAAASAESAAAGEADTIVDAEMTTDEQEAKTEEDATAPGGTSKEVPDKKDGNAVQAHVVFIKNLNWETTTEDVKEFVGKCVVVVVVAFRCAF